MLDHDLNCVTFLGQNQKFFILSRPIFSEKNFYILKICEL